MFQTYFNSFLRYSHTFNNIATLTIGINAKTINIVKCLFFHKLKEYLFTKSFYHYLQTSQGRDTLLLDSYQLSRKALARQPYSRLYEMNFCISSDTGSSSSDGTSGIAVCYQFWITNRSINIIAVCPLTSISASRKSIFLFIVYLLL